MSTGTAPLLRLARLDLATLDPLRQAEVWAEQGWIRTAEKRAAERYQDKLSRMQHLAGRALARRAIARISGCSPFEIEIVTDASGKPSGVLSGGRPAPHFSISHSRNTVVCGACESAIGIDIESKKTTVEALAIARSYFSRSEAAWIAARPSTSSTRFAALWTIKEAFLKATGVGLSVALDGIRLDRLGPRHARVHSDEVDQGRPWYCRIGTLPGGFWLSVCIARPFAAVSVVDELQLDAADRTVRGGY